MRDTVSQLSDTLNDTAKSVIGWEFRGISMCRPSVDCFH